MPFDGTHSQYTITHVKRANVPLVKRANVPISVRVTLIVSSVLVFVLVCCMVEAVFPDRGPLTLISNGPSVVRQNVIAHAIMDDAKRLKFTVNGYPYQVITPDHALTADEQTAWLGFAKWKNYPVYSADGPLAIDP